MLDLIIIALIDLLILESTTIVFGCFLVLEYLESSMLDLLLV